MNNPDLKTIIIKILEIVGYEDDKEKYANEIVGKCLVKTIDKLILSLPTDKQDELNKLAEAETDKNKVFDLLKSKFTDEEFLQEFKNVSEDVFGEMMQSLAPTLTDEKAAELTSFINSLPKQTATS